MSRLPVSLVFLLVLAAPALAIRTTPQRELTPRQIDLAPFDQASGHLATDGTDFMAVWFSLGAGVLGARVNASGLLVDEVPFVVATDGEQAEIAWGVDRYLAVWQTRGRITGRFIQRDGTPGEPFVIGERRVYNAFETHLAFNGRVFLAMWFDLTWRGALIDPSGVVLKELVTPANATDADLGTLGETFYFVYSRRYDYEMVPTLVTIDGEGSVGSQIELGPHAQLVEKMHIASTGRDLIAAWSTGWGREINDVRITPGGVGTSEVIPVNYKWMENVIVEGSDYLLIYGDNPQKFARRPAAAEAFPVIAPTYTIAVDAATNGSDTMMILRRNSPFDRLGGDLYVMKFGGSARPLAVAPRYQDGPDIAPAGEVSLAVWLEPTSATRNYTVFGMLLGRDGTAISESPFVIGRTTVQIAPHVASNGSQWLVVWRTETALNAARVASDGTLLDLTPLSVGGPAQSEGSVSWDGTSYVVLFARGPKPYVAAPTVVHVPPVGDPTAPNTLSVNESPYAPSIASGPNGSLIVWAKGDGQIRGALLTQSDVAVPLSFPLAGESYGWTIPVTVAWNRDAYLVVIASGGTIRWMRVDAFGNATVSPWSIPSSKNVSLRVSAFEDSFLLLWSDPALHAAILDRDGDLVEGPMTIGPASSRAVASESLILSAHVIEWPTKVTSRVFAQTIRRTQEAMKRRAVR